MENYSHCVKKPSGKYTVVPFSIPATEKETRTHRVWGGKRDPQTRGARGHRCPSGPAARPAPSRRCRGGGRAGRPPARPGEAASHGVLKPQRYGRDGSKQRALYASCANSGCPRRARDCCCLTEKGGLWELAAQLQA